MLIIYLCIFQVIFKGVILSLFDIIKIKQYTGMHVFTCSKIKTTMQIMSSKKTYVVNFWRPYFQFKSIEASAMLLSVLKLFYFLVVAFHTLQQRLLKSVKKSSVSLLYMAVVQCQMCVFFLSSGLKFFSQTFWFHTHL